ncbi:hypothetical protein [Polycladomyces subterraneus]|uniref:DUF2723 domain-containing protein n=1 Tax=Polycladomyces subterraneus TaxID=1016997 RepID=A0ABT8IL47_9BACL|nr:hypothetical protein [Polycladomyces subterraneus]MDN4593455.1 DUF2723 domain-containing protein [Polycladomyces subterraneus]
MRVWMKAAGLVLAAVLVRLFWTTDWPESWDAVDFALALRRYDLFAMQPHFPGYPFFILAGHFFLPFIQNEYLSLSWVSAVSGGIGVGFFYGLARRFLPEIWAFWAAVWLTVHPMTWLASEQPMSDAMGLATAILLWWTVSFSLRWPDGDQRHGWVLVSGAVVAAVLLGVRLSYWPLTAVLFYPAIRLLVVKGRWQLTAERVRFLILAAGLGVGLTGAWVLAVSNSEGGVTRFFRLGSAFTEGHFTQWGDTAFTGAPSWVDRMIEFFRRQIWMAAMGGWYPTAPAWQWITGGAVAAALLAAVCFGRRWGDHRVRLVALWIIPYGLWIFFGQNVEKWRHILPLIPAMILVAMWGIRRLAQRRRSAAFGLLALILTLQTCQGASLVRIHHDEKPAVVEMADYVKKHYDPDHVVLITWEEERVLYARDPRYETILLHSWPVFTGALTPYRHGEKEVLITGAVVDGFGPRKDLLRPYLREVARFESHLLIDPVYHTIRLYEIDVKGFFNGAVNGVQGGRKS